MIPKKYYAVTTSAILSVVMGLVMSGIVTAINTGVGEGYFGRWIGAFVIVLPIAFVSMQFLGPFARFLATALTSENEEKADN